MTGTELKTFITSLNGEASIDETLLTVLVNTAKTVIEEERPWLVLMKVNTSKSASSSNSWQTSIDLSTITDFSKFYNDTPVRLFDGSNRTEYYDLKPFDRRLEYKDISNTCVYDEANKLLYLNGVTPFSGTLYIYYQATTTDIDLTSTSTVWSSFPTRFTPILGYYAMGIHGGAVDYDSITARQAPENIAVMRVLKESMEKWDNDKQLATLETNDPTTISYYPRSARVNRDE